MAEGNANANEKRKEETLVAVPAPGLHLPLAAMLVWVGDLLGSDQHLYWAGNEAQVWDLAEQAWPLMARVFAQAECS